VVGSPALGAAVWTVAGPSVLVRERVPGSEGVLDRLFRRKVAGGDAHIHGAGLRQELKASPRRVWLPAATRCGGSEAAHEDIHSLRRHGRVLVVVSPEAAMHL
jgi:hypothetical protein